MKFVRPMAASLLLVLVGQPQVFAASTPVELKWDELYNAIYSQRVELKLPNATIRGDVAAVRSDALVLDVKKTSDSKVFPKGNAVIPRISVTLLKVESQGSHWRTLGTVLGVLGGVVLGGYIAAKTASDAGPGIAIFLSSASAITVAGSLAGHNLDKHMRIIRVVP